MFLSRFSTPTALALTLASFLPIVGCAASAEDDESDEVTTQSQAIGVGDAVNGARAAAEVVSMLKTYQKYGTLKISTDMIFDKVGQVQEDITALKESVNEIQSVVTATHRDVLNLPALSKTNEIYALLDGYRVATASKDPAVKAKFLEALAKNQATQGTLKWADLATLHDVIVGRNGSSSLLTLVTQAAAGKGVAEVGSDPVGRFMMEKRLVQEEAFFLLSEASAKDPSVDLAAQKSAHDARMAEQDEAFSKATDVYNGSILDAAGNARGANVQECFYDDDVILGIKKWPDSGLYSFNDRDPSWRTDPTNPWGTAIHGPDFTLQGRQACVDAHTTHVRRQVAKVRSAQMQKLWAAEQVFVGQTKEKKAITLSSAQYGKVNDVTGFVGFACQGKASCAYKVDAKVIGDLEEGVQKAFVVRYSCGTDTVIRQASIAAEAQGSTVTLSCQ